MERHHTYYLHTTEACSGKIGKIGTYLPMIGG